MPDESFTIEVLARRTGMTVRALRSWNSKGLLQPPEIKRRTGYYTDRHVRRVEHVRALIGEGYNLGVIARMLATADDEGSVVAFAQAVVSSHGDRDQELVVTPDDIAAPWHGAIPDHFVDDLVALGLLEPIGGGRFRVASPRLFRITERLAAEGIPAPAVLEVTRALSVESDRIARAYLDLFVRHVWGGWDDALDTERDWDALRERMLRLRELSGEATSAMVALQLDRLTESHIAEVSD
ncbi:MerR family transcriptional regulator [Solicola gregarius]|uniref:MerR family transcriptional regulator n=1 Tax=Solicola gregarius TaxID=2908642 RepID=A0AA46TIW2_9ACTN|nr:MerR family transcriptional regulator [Solicola gregarius]UYM05943.1 MerR family transcriptional regulator [Solicola gregarius]